MINEMNKEINDGLRKFTNGINAIIKHVQYYNIDLKIMTCENFIKSMIDLLIKGVKQQNLTDMLQKFRLVRDTNIDEDVVDGIAIIFEYLNYSMETNVFEYIHCDGETKNLTRDEFKSFLCDILIAQNNNINLNLNHDSEYISNDETEETVIFKDENYPLI